MFEPLNSIILKEDKTVILQEKFGKYFSNKTPDLYDFVNSSGVTLASSSIDDYYSTLSNDANLHTIGSYGFATIKSGISLKINTSKFKVHKKYSGLQISPNIDFDDRFSRENISSLNLTLPKDTKFYVTIIKYNHRRIDSKLQIKIVDSPITSIIDSYMNVNINFIEHIF